MPGSTLQTASLQRAFHDIAYGFDGRVGACAKDEVHETCLHGEDRFSLQSVMKLIVTLAVLDEVDTRGWQLNEPVTVHKEDLSLNVQPIAELVAAHGEFQTTVGDLLRRAIIDSDSAAADILVRKLGGPQQVQAFLSRKRVEGVRVDRDERHLQTETTGLFWKPEYTDSAVLNRARASVTDADREKAFRLYQKDKRDTATPVGMTTLLQRLAAGDLLSLNSTEYVLDVMGQTVTFPDRLKAGVSKGWSLAHKTGTSGNWHGITVATNDVGIMRAPDGHYIAIVVFIGNSRASSQARAALMAKMAAATIRAYQPTDY